MKLNHLNLTVSDPEKMQEFLVKHFGFKAMRKANKSMALLTDDDGIELSLMHPKMGKETEIRYPATFHIGFVQETEEAVNELNGKLRADGYDLPEPSKQHGCWIFYFETPWGITIEVLA